MNDGLIFALKLMIIVSLSTYSIISLVNVFDKLPQKATQQTQPTSRITLKETKEIGGYYYSIIQIDSVEYLTSYHGGIIRITK